MDKSILNTKLDRIEDMDSIFVTHVLLPDGEWSVGAPQLITWRGGNGMTFAETYKRAEEDLGGIAELHHSLQVHVVSSWRVERSCLIKLLQEEDEAEREIEQVEAASQRHSA
jgi:hypothetical protein